MDGFVPKMDGFETKNGQILDDARERESRKIELKKKIKNIL
jgi:hypothetical protein